MISERIQNAIHTLETGIGARIVWTLAGALAIFAMGLAYDLRAYRNFTAPEAMDSAQVARNLVEGHGFSTEFIRPFSLYLIQKHNRALHPDEVLSTNNNDFAEIVHHPHPDLANAPLYPVALAGLMHLRHPIWPVKLEKSFWADGDYFRRYQPEFNIAIFNQVLLLVVVGLTFLIARKLFDLQVACLATLLTLGSELLWKFSVSGLSTLMLLVIFLGLFWFLLKVEEHARAEPPDFRRLFVYAIGAGLMVGLGMLTRYAFGWMIVPVMVFLILIGGSRRAGLAVVAMLAFTLIVSPWVARNLEVSGTWFGTAGYAVAENTENSEGSRLMQSVDPSLRGIYQTQPYIKKFMQNTRGILQNDILHLGEGWGGMLFFTGLLLGLRNPAARRLRYFTLISLGVMIVVQAMGATQLTVITPELNSENLLCLFTPLVFIFGAAFFFTLLDQMKTPSPGVRYVVMGVLAGLVCRPWIWAVVISNQPMAYPPYHPVEIQKICGWMKPDELMMSDLPWAVAWYGDRTCTWTTANSDSDFYALNDYIKPVSGLYLSVNCLDSRLLSDCMQGGEDSWPHFALRAVTLSQIPKGFPLRVFPDVALQSGMFLTDYARW